jgi:hypothetical protein
VLFEPIFEIKIKPVRHSLPKTKPPALVVFYAILFICLDDAESDVAQSIFSILK